MGHRDDRQHYAEFKALIDELRRDRQLRWIVTTGRHYGGYRSYTSSLARAGIFPDLLVTGRNRVFGRHGKGYRMQPVYTARVMAAAVLGHVQASRTLKQMHHHLSDHVQGVRRVRQLPDRFTLRFATLEAATESMRWIKQRIRDLPALKAQQVERELSVIQITCRKGTAVRVLSERLGIPRDEILTIGDSRTDRCFMDRRVAFHTGCPLNTDEETRETVHDAKGHLSTQFSMAGSIDVIRATLDGNVSSEMPPLPEDMPRRRRTGAGGSRSGSLDRKHLLHSYILGAAIVGITLAVFASFGIMPFSELIMKPVHLLFRLFSGIWSMFS
jgi:hypothetical protein